MQPRLCIEIVVLLFSLFGLATLAFSSITELPPEGDAQDYAAMAIHIAIDGVVSESEQSDAVPHPSMHREPGYPAVAAVWLYLFGPNHQLSVRCILKGETTCAKALKSLKRANAAIIVLIGLTAFLIARIWFASMAYGFAALFMTTLNTSTSGLADQLVAEPLAALLLLLASALMAVALTSASRMHAPASAFGAGVALGGLMLTKAIFFYFGPVLLVMGLVLAKITKRAMAISSLILILAIAYLMAGAWVWRNYQKLGVPSIASQRSVLAIRAEYTFMPWNEYWLAYIYFVPKIGPMVLQHYFPYERHAKLSRDNPDGYYRRGKHGTGIVAQRAGPEKPSTQEIQRTAARVLLERWAENFALVPLFAYRGSWMPIGYGYLSLNAFAPQLGKTLRLMTMLVLVPLVPVLFAMFFLALRARSIPWLIFLMPCIYSFIFHATLTHYIPRYSQPMIPCLLIAALGLIHKWRSGRMASPIAVQPDI